MASCINSKVYTKVIEVDDNCSDIELIEPIDSSEIYTDNSSESNEELEYPPQSLPSNYYSRQNECKANCGYPSDKSKRYYGHCYACWYGKTVLQRERIFKPQIEYEMSVKYILNTLH